MSTASDAAGYAFGLIPGAINQGQGFLDWMFGGNATKGIGNGPATGAYQTSYLKNMLQRGSPTMNPMQSDQERAQQQQLAQMLGGVANGTQAGPGELAVQRQVGNAQAQQTAGASMARGADAALAARTAARNQADIGVNGAGQAGIAQMNDKMAAAQQLSGLLGQTRSQDIGIAQGNQQSQMQQENLQLGALAQMLGIDQTTLQTQLAKAGINMKDQGMFPGLMQAGGQLLGGIASKA